MIKLFLNVRDILVSLESWKNVVPYIYPTEPTMTKKIFKKNIYLNEIKKTAREVDLSPVE